MDCLADIRFALRINWSNISDHGTNGSSGQSGIGPRALRENTENRAGHRDEGAVASTLVVDSAAALSPKSQARASVDGSQKTGARSEYPGPLLVSTDVGTYVVAGAEVGVRILTKGPLRRGVNELGDHHVDAVVRR